MNYYYSQGGKTHGPTSIDGLKKLAAAGQVNRDAVVWIEGAKEGQYAMNVPGLFVPSSPPVNDVTGVIATAVKSRLTKGTSMKPHSLAIVIQKIVWAACGCVVVFSLSWGSATDIIVVSVVAYVLARVVEKITGPGLR